MNNGPTWAQRKAWNNDGMDPDWKTTRKPTNVYTLEEFKNAEIGWKINDLLLHYKNGHDSLYLEKANIFKLEFEAMQSELAYLKRKLADTNK